MAAQADSGLRERKNGTSSLINEEPKEKKFYSWDEIGIHNKKNDSWLVIEGKVYDVSSWALRHPGGPYVLNVYAGQDATEPFYALHPDVETTRKYLSALCIGEVRDNKEEGNQKLKPHFNEPLLVDFRQLREKVRKMGLYDVNWWFYMGMLGHIILLEALSYYLMLNFGTGWPIYLLCAVILTTAQAQAGWLQHDFGHLSVFKNSRWNHWLHTFTLCHLKGASRTWWNWRHFLHHAKPNVVYKDPDIRMSYVFVVGKELAKRWGLKKRGFMPYGLQHYYWHLIGPPLLIPTYFHVENIWHAVKKHEWADLFWVTTFYVRHFLMYVPLLGFWGAFWFYMFFRVLESHWFVYVTQMNHIPMHIDFDHKVDWPTLQNMATCNIEHSLFNDWFTGHLNFQIEHHLFPTMPRHSYAQANKLVKELYAKHGIDMETKTLWKGMVDIVGSLKQSSEIWHEAYYGHTQ